RGSKWFVFVPAEELKNGEFRGPYEMPVNKSFFPILEKYLKERSKRTKSPYLFPRNRKSDLPMTGAGISSNLTQVSKKFIPNYVPEGFGAHAFRHIMAAHLCKTHPSGKQLAASHLHDSEFTIAMTYGHFLPQHLAPFIDQAFDAALSRYNDQNS